MGASLGVDVAEFLAVGWFWISSGVGASLGVDVALFRRLWALTPTICEIGMGASLGVDAAQFLGDG